MNDLKKVDKRTMASFEAEVRSALAKAGSGVLTKIDMAALLNEKLGVERAPIKVLGACNPKLINQALEIDSSVALSVPCHVALQ